MLKSIIIFSCGVAVGAGACFLILKKKVAEEVAAKVEDERDMLRTFYQNKTEKNEEVKNEPVFNELKEERKTYNKMAENYISKPSIEEVLAKSYNVTIQQEETPEEPDELPDNISQPDGPREKQNEPYGVSAEDFVNTCDYYDKTSLTYFEGDGVVADEDGEVVLDAMSLLGTDFPDMIGEFEEGVAYIRNDKIECDYEVTREKGRYYDRY